MTKGKFPNGLKTMMERHGIRSADLARAIGTAPQNIQRLRDGERELTAAWAQSIAAHLPGTDPTSLIFANDDEAIGQKTPVVGYVGAGAVYVPFETSVVEEIDRPTWANENTVAAEIRGDSLGSLFDRWLVYFDKVESAPTSDMLNRLCVVGLADRRVMVKKIKRGEIKGLYTLISNYEPPIYDVAVEWCAVVKNMAPR